MAKYYITGGLGVIGSCFAKEVLKEGHEVTILDAAEEYRNVWMAEYLKSNYKNVKIKIERMETSSFEGLEEHDFILHAAAHTGIPHSAIAPNDDWLSNAEATRNLLERLRLCKKKIPMVALSSVKPYRVHDLPYIKLPTRYMWTHNHPISETQVLEPDEVYACSKMAQSGLCMAYARTYNLPVMVFRCSNLYGPAPSHGPRHGWLTWFALSAVLDKQIDIQGTGFQVRDMLYSTDVNRAVFDAFDCMDECRGNVYNIGGGIFNSVSIIEAVNLIEKINGPVSTKKGPGRTNEDPIFITDYKKFSDTTGWKPRVSLEEGLTGIISWAKENKTAIQKMYEGIY